MASAKPAPRPSASVSSPRATAAPSETLKPSDIAARALPSPQTVFQPAYPLAVATSTALGVPLAWSGFAVSALLHLASAALLVSLLMRATGLAPSVAAAITILWLCLAANFSVVVDALSEPMLVFATLASAWCYARSLRAHRRIAWLFAHEDEAPPATPEQVFDARTSLAAFARLSAEQRALLMLVSVEGLGYREAADTLGIPIGTVMSRLSRARQALRALQEESPSVPSLKALR